MILDLKFSKQIVRSMKRVLSADDDYVPLSIKFRTGIQEGVNTAHTLIPKLKVSESVSTPRRESRLDRVLS